MLCQTRDSRSIIKWGKGFFHFGINTFSCLCLSRYTEHSVKNSPYKEGKRDVIREFTDSSRKYGVRYERIAGGGVKIPFSDTAEGSYRIVIEAEDAVREIFAAKKNEAFSCERFSKFQGAWR